MGGVRVFAPVCHFARSVVEGLLMPTPLARQCMGKKGKKGKKGKAV